MMNCNTKSLFLMNGIGVNSVYVCVYSKIQYENMTVSEG